jgi:hypothetical protein
MQDCRTPENKRELATMCSSVRETYEVRLIGRNFLPTGMNDAVSPLRLPAPLPLCAARW